MAEVSVWMCRGASTAAGAGDQPRKSVLRQSCVALELAVITVPLNDAERTVLLKIQIPAVPQRPRGQVGQSREVLTHNTDHFKFALKTNHLV